MKGADLKLWRKSNGWSQADLMEELEVSSRQTISTWENSECIPRTIELAIIAIDQIEACRKRTGFQNQYTQESIANRRFDAWKRARREMSNQVV